MSAEDGRPSTLRNTLDLAQSGDTAALAELYNSHGRLVFQAALRLTARRTDAEDVTHDVFVRLPLALRGFTGTAANFPGWLRRVAVRQALMHLRSSRRRNEVDMETAGNLFGRSDGVVDRMSIETALQRIPSDHRAVFILKEVEGYDHAEIAESLGISVANSEIRLHRARKELRVLLGGSR